MSQCPTDISYLSTENHSVTIKLGVWIDKRKVVSFFSCFRFSCGIIG